MEPNELGSLLEALLFVAAEPLSAGTLLRTIDDGNLSTQDVRSALDRLAEEYDAQGRGFQLMQFGGGYQIVTREIHAPYVKTFLAGRQKARLSRAALETIAVIAYKQPITRLEIERVRGVDAGGVLSTLLERGVVQIKGRDPGPGRPLLYATTQSFLDYFGLTRLSDLPNMDEIASLARAESPTWTEDERERMEKEGVEPDTMPPPVPEQAEAPSALEYTEEEGEPLEREAIEAQEDDRARFQEIVGDIGSEMGDQA
jgi:segregation and condensation protein B